MLERERESDMCTHIYMYRERERDRDREENPSMSPILSASALQNCLSTLYKGSRQEIGRVDIMQYGMVLCGIGMHAAILLLLGRRSEGGSMMTERKKRGRICTHVFE